MHALHTSPRRTRLVSHLTRNMPPKKWTLCDGVLVDTDGPWPEFMGDLVGAAPGERQPRLASEMQNTNNEDLSSNTFSVSNSGSGVGSWGGGQAVESKSFSPMRPSTGRQPRKLVAELTCKGCSGKLATRTCL